MGVTMEVTQFDEYERDDTAIIDLGNGSQIRVDFPAGHKIGDFDILISHGDGWEKIKLKESNNE